MNTAMWLICGFNVVYMVYLWRLHDTMHKTLKAFHEYLAGRR